MNDKTSIIIVRDEMIKLMDSLAIPDEDREEISEDMGCFMQDEQHYNANIKILKKTANFQKKWYNQ